MTPSSKTENPGKGGKEIAETPPLKGVSAQKLIDSEDEGGSNGSSPSGSAFDLTKLKGKKGGSASKAKDSKKTPPLPKEPKGKPKVRLTVRRF